MIFLVGPYLNGSFTGIYIYNNTCLKCTLKGKADIQWSDGNMVHNVSVIALPTQCRYYRNSVEHASCSKVVNTMANILNSTIKMFK